jgi:hypothetical protein
VPKTTGISGLYYIIFSGITGGCLGAPTPGEPPAKMNIKFLLVHWAPLKNLTGGLRRFRYATDHII